jgi:hypothetical protein
MQCNDYPKALDLCKCSDEDAFLWLGSVPVGTPVNAVLTWPSGRRVIIPVEEDGGEYKIPHPELAPGETFLIQLLNANNAPVGFEPYQLNGTVFAPVSTAYDGVWFDAALCFEPDGDTYTGPDQWITLP